MTKHEFVFTKKFPERLYRHVVFWFVYYIFSLFAVIHPFLEKTSFGKWLVVEIVEISCHVTIQMFFCYMILYILWPKLLDKNKPFAFGVSILFLFILTNGIYYIVHTTIFKSIHHYAGMPFWKGYELILWYGFISTLSLMPMSAGIAIAIKVLKRFYNKLQENQQLTRENANAELQLLKAQIHPHFLFNTLNNIYAFTLNKSMQAPQLVMNLSDTLQYMISDCEADSVPLDQELKMINDYIDLEKVRYGNRLDIQIDIAGEIKHKNIAPLLMIPFIENSFKHGASKILRDAWIKLFIQADENVLHFTLTNSKPSDEIINEKGGIGLTNVKKRLELLYPRQHLLAIESTIHTFTINMQVPLNKIHGKIVV